MSVTILEDKHHPYLENKEEFKRVIQEFVLTISTLKTT